MKAEAQIVRTAKELIRYQSVSSDYEQLHAVVRYVEEQFIDLDFFIKKFNFEDVPSILVTTE